MCDCIKGQMRNIEGSPNSEIELAQYSVVLFVTLVRQRLAVNTYTKILSPITLATELTSTNQLVGQA